MDFRYRAPAGAISARPCRSAGPGGRAGRLIARVLHTLHLFESKHEKCAGPGLKIRPPSSALTSASHPRSGRTWFWRRGDGLRRLAWNARPSLRKASPQRLAVDKPTMCSRNGRRYRPLLLWRQTGRDRYLRMAPPTRRPACSYRSAAKVMVPSGPSPSCRRLGVSLLVSPAGLGAGARCRVGVSQYGNSGGRIAFGMRFLMRGTNFLTAPARRREAAAAWCMCGRIVWRPEFIQVSQIPRRAKSCAAAPPLGALGWSGIIARVTATWAPGITRVRSPREAQDLTALHLRELLLTRLKTTGHVWPDARCVPPRSPSGLAIAYNCAHASRPRAAVDPHSWATHSETRSETNHGIFIRLIGA